MTTTPGPAPSSADQHSAKPHTAEQHGARPHTARPHTAESNSTTRRTQELPPGPLHTGSLRRRVVLGVLALLAVLLVVLSVTVDATLRSRTEGQLEQRLLDRVAVAEALADQVGAQDLTDRLSGEGVSVRLTTSDGTVYTAGPTIEGAAEASTAKPSPRPAPKPAPPGQPAEVIQSGDVFSIERGLSIGTLDLATNAEGLRQTLAQVRLVLVGSSVAVLLLAAIALLALVGRLLAPLDRITATARSITAGDRGRRLLPDQPESELGRTASAFDDMLDALEGAERRAIGAEERVRDFLLEAAHELRTPLAGIQAAAETVLVTDPGRAQREQLLVGVVREARRATRLAEDMLTMGRIDRGLELQVRPADLGELAALVVEAATRSAPRTQVSVVHHGRVLAQVDPDRITQVLTNVVDNAVRAAGSGGTVRVEVGPDLRVAVRDNGPGVPGADRERIFERLVRLDEARTHDTAGAGLGLAIARGLARAHGGDLALVDQPRGAPGALFVLTLPPEVVVPPPTAAGAPAGRTAVTEVDGTVP